MKYYIVTIPGVPEYCDTLREAKIRALSKWFNLNEPVRIDVWAKTRDNKSIPSGLIFTLEIID